MIRDGVATEIIIVSKMLSYVLTIYPPPEIGVFLKILVFFLNLFYYPYFIKY